MTTTPHQSPEMYVGGKRWVSARVRHEIETLVDDFARVAGRNQAPIMFVAGNLVDQRCDIAIETAAKDCGFAVADLPEKFVSSLRDSFAAVYWTTRRREREIQ